MNEDFEDMMEQLLKIIKLGSKSIKRTEVYGLIVSSALTPDCGYETAIIDKNGVYIVERYENKEECLSKHEKWCEEAKTLTKVTDVGWLGIVEKQEIIIERNFDVHFLNKL